ncbi:MAG: sodium/proline symporter PutP [Lachnospiraceae bacterium]|nr:sodium/proline symporter PutP [Lachnospiraceae bacterium]
MTTANICILISIIAYLLFVIGIGVVFSRKNKTTDDFYLGGRKLGPFVTAMSAEASDMSSWLLMGLPGVAYLTGLADAFWTAAGLAIGTYINWLVVAKRLRKYTVKCNNSTTIPVFFSNRYRDDKKILSVIAALVIIIFFVPYTASGFAACGKLFASLFGMDYFTAMIISAVVIVGYTALGGFLAASTSDFMQSIVMTIAIFVVLGYGVVTAGGMGTVMENAESLAGYFSLTSIHDPATGSAGAYGIMSIFSMLAWGLGYFGMPHVLLRFMAIEDANKLKLSRRIATVWVVISLGVAIMIGIVGNAMTKAGVIPALEDSETIIIAISDVIAQHGIVPALIAGLILAGILAATMSTADSQLLAASSSVSQNIIKEVFFKDLSEKAAMIIARVSVVIISVIAVFIAKDPNSSVFDIVSFAWAGFGAAFGPVMLLALFWKRSNKWGALAGMFTGGVMVFVWKFLVKPIGGVWGIYELLPAFLVAIAVNIIISLLTKAPSQDMVDEFEAVKAECK